MLFQNVAEFTALYPNDCAPAWRFCAPRVESGATLRRIWRQIAALAGIGDDVPGHDKIPPLGEAATNLDGHLDRADAQEISGWAWAPGQPEVPVELEILDGDGVIARVVAAAALAAARAARPPHRRSGGAAGLARDHTVPHRPRTAPRRNLWSRGGGRGARRPLGGRAGRGAASVPRRGRAGAAAAGLHRLESAAAYAGLARRWCPGARPLFSVADLPHLRLARRAKMQGKPKVLAGARSVKQLELLAMRLADAVLTHSTADPRYLATEAPGARIHVVPWPLHPASARAFDARSGVAFIGDPAHPPPPDALLWLMQEVMPLVWERQPAIPCRIFGPNWPEVLFRDADPRLRPAGPEVPSGAALAG